ncbi:MULTISPECIES: sulfite oxidase-like oxidoreductase [Alicyclobacillus]|uniref:Sulfite oxidase-like oxidoreductase n=1 Tax=Alicyclobacillus acidoterrestris (strain ATCC 49025 / DSM 3922 / CIP 106132 / NCIMB 13137 / GD3B) TaxID=1356854 RepID=T0BNN3_ALIAG|nr:MULTISPECIES: sulfite oxidase-like oxidoreductase [Alicyclobacillus]EPZ42369.1 hypothetical protein N007_15125 [Alicyclobacillus acidoterrestris ATCC 49025]UNO50496.1 sulfite oxidase-like oxidoreductase [Alicyclobacillus acidoterrestris]
MSKPQTNKLPPGQVETSKFPVIHSGPVPDIDLNTWDFRLFGLVSEELRLTWNDFMELPKYTSTSDAHCVTTWSHTNNEWEGVALHTIMSLITLAPEANYALVHAEGGYTTSLRVDDLLREGVMLAYKHNGEVLSRDHGFPVRLIVPHLYFWKSAKWVRGIELLAEPKLGFWEQRGYDLYGDPWLEQRYRDTTSRT